MKKIFQFFTGLVVFVCIIIVIKYIIPYTINDNEQDIEENIEQFISRGESSTANIDIKKMVDIDDEKFILFVVNGQLGEAELKRGLNSKYKIESTGYGSKIFRYRVRKTNKEQYLVIGGKNYDMKINYITVIAEGEEFRIAIPQQEYFISYCVVSKEIKTVLPSEFKLFDIDNNDITDEIFRRYYN